MTVLRGEYEHLVSIHKEFSKAVIMNYRAEHGGSAMAEFNRHLSTWELLNMGAAKLKYDTIEKSDADYEIKARALMNLCDTGIPCLLRAFGEAAILKAFPENVRNDQTLQLFLRAGGAKTATLIKKII